MPAYLRNNIWQISSPNPADPNKPFRESTGIKNEEAWDEEAKRFITKAEIKKKVEAMAAKKLVDQAEGKYLDMKIISNITLEWFYQEYLNKYAKRENRAWKLCEYRIKHIYQFFAKSTPILSIRRKMVIDYREFRLQQEPKPENATVNREAGLIIGMLNKAVEWEYIEANPVSRLKKLPENDPRKRNLSRAEITWCIKWMITNSEIILLELISCYLNLGFRLRELTRLEWEQVDFNTGIITIIKVNAKGKKEKLHPMNKVVKRILLRRHLKRDPLNPLVFPGIRNKHKPCDFRYRLDKLREAALKEGVKDFTTHDLRRTFGNMVRSKTDIVTTRDLMGHASVTTTEDYTDAVPDHLKLAVENLALDNNTLLALEDAYNPSNASFEGIEQ